MAECVPTGTSCKTPDAAREGGTRSLHGGAGPLAKGRHPSRWTHAKTPGAEASPRPRRSQACRGPDRATLRDLEPGRPRGATGRWASEEGWPLSHERKHPPGTNVKTQPAGECARVLGPLRQGTADHVARTPVLSVWRPAGWFPGGPEGGSLPRLSQGPAAAGHPDESLRHRHVASAEGVCVQITLPKDSSHRTRAHRVQAASSQSLDPSAQVWSL